MLRPLSLLALGTSLLGAQTSSELPCPFGSPARSALAWRFGNNPGVVSGRVLDVTTGRPVTDGSISLRLVSDVDGIDSVVSNVRTQRQVFYTHRTAARLRAQPDSSGTFRIANVAPGSYRVSVLTMGRGSVQDTLTIGAGGGFLLAALAPWEGDIACVVVPDRPAPPNEELKPTALAADAAGSLRSPAALLMVRRSLTPAR